MLYPVEIEEKLSIVNELLLVFGRLCFIKPFQIAHMFIGKKSLLLH